MKKNPVTEYVRAVETKYPMALWKFSVFNQACFPMIIRGTRIFDVQIKS
jgi:hypothetical protein